MSYIKPIDIRDVESRLRECLKFIPKDTEYRMAVQALWVIFSEAGNNPFKRKFCSAFNSIQRTLPRPIVRQKIAPEPSPTVIREMLEPVKNDLEIKLDE